MITRTPTESDLDAVALAFLARVSPGQEPVWLDCEPTPGLGDGYCFPIVERRVAEQGGAMVLGWAIWIWPGVLIEAEFHGLWRDTEGVLHDIVPRNDGTKRLLFLPAPTATWDGRQVNNIRQALSERTVVRDYVQAADDLGKVMASSGGYMAADTMQHYQGRVARAYYDLKVADARRKANANVNVRKKKRR